MQLVDGGAGKIAGEPALFKIVEVSKGRSGLVLEGGDVAVQAVEALAEAGVGAPGFDDDADGVDALEFGFDFIDAEGRAHVDEGGFHHGWSLGRTCLVR